MFAGFRAKNVHISRKVVMKKYPRKREHVIFVQPPSDPRKCADTLQPSPRAPHPSAPAATTTRVKAHFWLRSTSPTATLWPWRRRRRLPKKKLNLKPEPVLICLQRPAAPQPPRWPPSWLSSTSRMRAVSRPRAAKWRWPPAPWTVKRRKGALFENCLNF